MKSLFRLLLVVLVLFVVALVSALTAMRFAIHGREVNTPNVVGKTAAEAARLAEQDGLQIEVEREYYSPSVPQGRILSQLPPADTQVRRGWFVRVAVSLGPQRVEIPNLLGESDRAAEINIRRRGLDVASVAFVPMRGSPADQVVSQSPPAGATGVSAPKISLLVTQAAPAGAFVMPSFVGQTLGAVTRTLEDAGFHVGAVTMPPNPDAALAQATPPPNAAPSPASIIVSQTPAAGQKAIVGSAVNFEVR